MITKRIFLGRIKNFELGLILVLVFSFTAIPALAQSGDTADSTLATPEQPAAAEKQVTSPMMPDLKGITIGMTADDVKDKLGKPLSSDATGMYFTFDNGEAIQLGIDKDEKVTMVAAIYSGRDAKAPGPTQIFGSESAVTPQADGKIYKMVRYPSAGFWIAYSRLNLEAGPMTIITIQKMDQP